MSARCSSHREFHQSWSCKRAGLREISANILSARTADKIDIIQFGTWNREAGPDFRDAAIRINGGEPIHGCVEIDLA